MRRICVWMIFLPLLAGFLSGCGGSGGSGQASDEFGLTGPVFQGGQKTLRIVLGATSIGTSHQLPIVFLLYDQFGQPAPDDSKILVSFNLGGKIDPSDLSTKEGHAEALYTSSSSAGVETISAAGLGVTGSATVAILAEPPSRPLVKVTPAADQVRTGQTVPIVVFVTNGSGNAVSTSVTMYSEQSGSFNPGSGNSDIGMFITQYTASSSVGVDRITAIAGGTIATASLAVVP